MSLLSDKLAGPGDRRVEVIDCVGVLIRMHADIGQVAAKEPPRVAHASVPAAGCRHHGVVATADSSQVAGQMCACSR